MVWFSVMSREFWKCEMVFYFILCCYYLLYVSLSLDLYIINSNVIWKYVFL